MEFLKEPYPYLHKGRDLVRTTGLIIILGFLFEYLLEPFERTPSEHLFSYWIICMIHAGLAAAIYFVYYLAITPFVNEDDWKVSKEIRALAVLIFFIGTGEFLVREVIYDNPYNVSWRYFFEEVRNAYLVGSVLLFIIIVLNYNRYNRRNQARASSLDTTQVQSSTDSKSVEMQASIASDHFTLVPSEVLCIRSDGNYLEFFLQDDAGSKKVLKRLTLQSASEQLSEFPFIVKTHRAFLVNIHQLQNVTGNAQGYQLAIKDLDFAVPVSRAHIQAFDEVIS